MNLSSSVAAEILHRLWSFILCSQAIQAAGSYGGSAAGNDAAGYGLNGWAGAWGWWWVWLIVAIVIIAIAASLGTGYRGRRGRTLPAGQRTADAAVDSARYSGNFAGVLFFVILIGIAIAALAWWGEGTRADYVNGTSSSGSVNNGADPTGNGNNSGSANNGDDGHNMATPGTPDSRLRTYGI